MVRRKTRVKAHDEASASREGDRVRLMETRPLSKDKRWRVVEVLGRAD
jgi:small subunit ribosomal protein S17